MAHFEKTDLEHLKKLCRLDFTPEEEADALASLQNILAQVESLKQIDTHGVETCGHVLREGWKKTLREDVAQNDLSREQFLANAPDQIGGMVRVPPILKPS
jgi:aspartyl-tRNA(Asn)/glutamyl-tRNA(Gln) amidotransferase subunit C